MSKSVKVNTWNEVQYLYGLFSNVFDCVTINRNNVTDSKKFILEGHNGITKTDLLMSTEISCDMNLLKTAELGLCTSLGVTTTVVYGDTDSTFNKASCDHLSNQNAKIEYCMDIGQDCAYEITEMLRDKNVYRRNLIAGQKAAISKAKELGQDTSDMPLDKFYTDFEFEKVLCPMLLFEKKNYATIKFEKKHEIATGGKHASTGIASIKRTYVQYVRKAQRHCLDIMLKERDVEKAKLQAIKYADDLLCGRAPIEDLIQTCSLKSADSYKNQNTPQLVLAQRIARRDPGSEPKSGDRVPYVLIDTGIKNDKKFNKIEDPKYAVEKDLNIDYLWYLEKQLMNPMISIFGIVESEPKKMFDKPIREYINRRNNQSEITSFFKFLNS